MRRRRRRRRRRRSDQPKLNFVVESKTEGDWTLPWENGQSGDESSSLCALQRAGKKNN